MNKLPFLRNLGRAGSLLTMLWLLTGCSAEASGHRANVILVLPDAPWLGPVVQQFREAGYATAVAGHFPRDPQAAGFAAHCVWPPGSPQHPWGPTVLQDGQMTTLPDDVHAAELFASYLARFAADTAGRPFLACWCVGSDPDLRSTVERLLQGLASAGTRGRPTVLLATAQGCLESSMTVLTAWPGLADAEVIVERVTAGDDLLATLLEMAGLAREAHGGVSFAAELRPPEMRTDVPR